MRIQINTDHNIQGNEALAAHVKGVVAYTLSRFSEHITRVEVHLSDQHGHKPGLEQNRCMMEVRLEGRLPATVTNDASSLDEAVDGAAEKLKHLLERSLGRRTDHHTLSK